MWHIRACLGGRESRAVDKAEKSTEHWRSAWQERVTHPCTMNEHWPIVFIYLSTFEISEHQLSQPKLWPCLIKKLCSKISPNFALLESTPLFSHSKTGSCKLTTISLPSQICHVVGTIQLCVATHLFFSSTSLGGSKLTRRLDIFFSFKIYRIDPENGTYKVVLGKMEKCFPVNPQICKMDKMKVWV